MCPAAIITIRADGTGDCPTMQAGVDAVDAALQADIDGEPRSIGGRMDIGADEWIDTDADGLTTLEDYEGVSLPPGPRTFYVDGVNGSLAYDGLAPVHIAGWRGPKRTLQSAIDAAQDGDRIVLNPGIHHAYAQFGGKAITVQSMDPDDPAVIAATVVDGALRFQDQEGRDTVLAGITVTGAEPLNLFASPTIRNCTITGGADFAVNIIGDPLL